MRVHHMVSCGRSSCAIFFHILINSTIFENEKLLNVKWVLWFSLQAMYETFLILRRNERDMIKNVLFLMWIFHCSCPILMNLEFFDRFSKIIQIKFRENASIDSRGFPCGRTDRHNEAYGLFLFYFFTVVLTRPKTVVVWGVVWLFWECSKTRGYVT
jgi:hypothetical protein